MKSTSVAMLPALAALGLAITVSFAQASPIGTSENFETQTLGAFPTGWLDVAAIDPTPPNPPLPSAIVVSTTDAHGNPTRALATNDFIAPSQGIYRIVPLSSVYTSKADIRVDRFGDTAPGTNPTTDWPMAMGVNTLQGTTDPAFIPSIQIYASSVTKGWRLFVSTKNTFADVDLGVPVTIGSWYGVEVDVDVNAATVRSRIADAATGTSLVDRTDSLTSFGAWNPAVDGAFDIEGFFDGELTATTTAGLAVVDNIDQTVAPIPEAGSLLLLVTGLAGAAAMRRRG